jgi:nucleoside-diphosphate-sugar epimerase
MLLRARYGSRNVVAGYIKGAEPTGELLESGPAEHVDITDAMQIAEAVKKYRIDTVYNMAALLSATAESKPQLAWHIGLGGLFNLLEVAREQHCAVFTPSSIGAFGDYTPKDRTPQDTVQRPQTMYGVTKVAGELLGDYYFKRFGVDTRSVRYPGLISHVAPPGGGTTDYAVEIYHSAAEGRVFKCPLLAGTFMDMMYMPDALSAAINLMEANPDSLVHRNSFNVTAMSVDPEALRKSILEYIPDFKMEYCVDPVRQAIADSWPNSLDDSCAKEEWGWLPEYGLQLTTQSMLRELESKMNQ